MFHFFFFCTIFLCLFFCLFDVPNEDLLFFQKKNYYIAYMCAKVLSIQKQIRYICSIYCKYKGGVCVVYCTNRSKEFELNIFHLIYNLFVFLSSSSFSFFFFLFNYAALWWFVFRTSIQLQNVYFMILISLCQLKYNSRAHIVHKQYLEGGHNEWNF